MAHVAFPLSQRPNQVPVPSTTVTPRQCPSHSLPEKEVFPKGLGLLTWNY